MIQNLFNKDNIKIIFFLKEIITKTQLLCYYISEQTNFGGLVMNRMNIIKLLSLAITAFTASSCACAVRGFNFNGKDENDTGSIFDSKNTDLVIKSTHEHLKLNTSGNPEDNVEELAKEEIVNFKEGMTFASFFYNPDCGFEAIHSVMTDESIGCNSHDDKVYNFFKYTFCISNETEYKQKFNAQVQITNFPNPYIVDFLRVMIFCTAKNGPIPSNYESIVYVAGTSSSPKYIGGDPESVDFYFGEARQYYKRSENIVSNFDYTTTGGSYSLFTLLFWLETWDPFFNNLYCDTKGLQVRVKIS